MKSIGLVDIFMDGKDLVAKTDDGRWFRFTNATPTTHNEGAPIGQIELKYDEAIEIEPPNIEKLDLLQ